LAELPSTVATFFSIRTLKEKVSERERKGERQGGKWERELAVATHT
jgi:hypothetical protein